MKKYKSILYKNILPVADFKLDFRGIVNAKKNIQILL